MSNHSEYKDTIIKVNNQDITDYLADEGYTVEWYDVSIDSGRTTNAKGRMHYNPVSTKYKIILNTKHLTQTEATAFFNQIKILQEHSVYFFDPYTGSYKTISCYRGDRSMTMKWDRTDRGMLYKPTKISLIEL